MHLHSNHFCINIIWYKNYVVVVQKSCCRVLVKYSLVFVFCAQKKWWDNSIVSLLVQVDGCPVSRAHPLQYLYVVQYKVQYHIDKAPTHRGTFTARISPGSLCENVLMAAVRGPSVTEPSNSRWRMVLEAGRRWRAGPTAICVLEPSAISHQVFVTICGRRFSFPAKHSRTQKVIRRQLWQDNNTNTLAT